MKNHCLFLWILVALCPIGLNAQMSCKTKEADLNTLIKARNYSGALIQWGDAKDCLAESESLYAIGEKIFENRIENASGDEKLKLVNSLVELYDSYDKNFPANKNANSIKKALLMQRNKIGNGDEIYRLLNEAFANKRETFSDPKALYTYFEMVFARFQQGDKGVSEGDLFELHDQLTVWISKLQQTAPSPGSYKTVMNGISSMMAAVATCEKLIPHYEKALPTHTEDRSWLEGAASTLSARNCTSNKTYVDIAAQWYKLAPDAKSAFALGTAYIRNKNLSKGLEYLNIAGELEKNAEEKAQTYYSIATLMGRDKAESIKFLRKAISSKPSFGKAYLFMAQLFAGAANECGSNEFEKKAIFLLASQTAEKAAAADPYLKSAAKQVSEMYLKKGPTPDEIKQSGLAGKTVNFKCWINESATIPGNK